MSKGAATEVKRSGVGKDFPVLWEAVSDSRRKLFWHWKYGCDVREVRRIEPPISLDEIKNEPRLQMWKGLRWNFQAKGRAALEIPEFAWKVILEIIDKREAQR